MRRVILVSQKETPSYEGRFFGCKEIYTTEYLDSLGDFERENILKFGKGDGIMLLGAEPFKYLQKYYHFGIRGENYFDCSKLWRLSMEGGAFLRVVLDFPEQGCLAEFLDPSFTEEVDFSWFRGKVIHTLPEAHKFLDWISGLPETEDLGFDFEASGMALDKIFEISGASLCTNKFGGFISFTDLRHNTTPEEYASFCKRFGEILYKRQSHLVTYNMQYEQAVAHRMFGVDLYNLLDASVYNVIEGYHLKKYSLKWTAQRVLGATVWDTEFDWISEKISEMLFTVEGKLKRDKVRVLKVDLGTYENTPEWKEICSRYPTYVTEFRALMREYFGNEFMCIPSEILGYYCNLDAFYTLLIHQTLRKGYSEDCIRTFMDNARLGARLHNCGLYIDEPFRLEYEKRCKEQIAWGVTYCATARCRIKMEKHSKKMAGIEKYTPAAQKLLRANSFFNGNPDLIAKYLLLTNLDDLEAYDFGVNEGQVLMTYGPEFADKFLGAVRESMEEAGMIKLYKKTGEKVVKSKIDQSIGGKKKILSILGQKLVPILGLDKIKINDKHIELEKYLYYERAYNELVKVSKTQLSDIMNIPQEIYAFGKKWSLLDYSDYVADNYFKAKSPEENDALCLELAKLFPAESAYLAAILESTQQLPEAEKYYDVLGISTVESGFAHFMKNWEQYYKGTPVEQTAYPLKVYTLAGQFYNDLGCDQVKEVWSNFNGYVAQEQFFPYVSDQYESYGMPFSESDLDNRFYFMRKMVINYLLYKKFSKVLSTYIDGMLADGKWVIEDSKHIPIREADPNEPGAIHKIFCHYEINTKSSKR